MNAFKKFLNDNRKELKWWQRNYFFAATVFIVLLNIILYAALGSWSIDADNSYSDYQQMMGFTGNKSHWYDLLYFKSLIKTFLSAFSHANWQHTLLNMLCFFVCGIYLERKLGSVKFFLLIICFCFFGNCAVAANNNSINFHGFSGVNYAIYAFILVNYLFYVIPKQRRKKLNIIYGGIMLALIYFSMCFNGGVQTVSFSWYPHDAIYNLGHYTSYLAGLIISVFLCATQFYIEKKYKRLTD